MKKASVQKHRGLEITNRIQKLGNLNKTICDE
jgi:hypothetical protein